MERQALRRVKQGSLTDDQIEKVGSTLMALDARMAELRDDFGLTIEDLTWTWGRLARFCLAKDAKSRCLLTAAFEPHLASAIVSA